jgi:hypothetical protein
VSGTDVPVALGAVRVRSGRAFRLADSTGRTCTIVHVSGDQFDLTIGHTVECPVDSLGGWRGPIRITEIDPLTHLIGGPRCR